MSPMQSTAPQPVVHEAGPAGVLPVTVGKLLGAGGSAQVYEGVMPDGTVCALKAVVHRLDGADKVAHGRSIRERTDEEAGVLARVPPTPYLPTVYGTGIRPIAPAQDYAGEVRRIALLVAMECIGGPSAADLCGRMPWGVAMRIGEDVVRGMLALRAVFPKIQHRDIKPANVGIALTPDGLYDRAVLLDLGAALTPQLRAEVSPDATVAGGIIGTVGYLPPESMESGYVARDESRDVFALGMTLYALHYGTTVYSRIPTRAEYARLWEALPDDVPSIVRSMIYPDPRGRPSWAEALDKLLLNVLFYRVGRGAFPLPPVTAKIHDFPESGRLLPRGLEVFITAIDTGEEAPAAPPAPRAVLCAVPDPSAEPEGTRFVRLHPETHEPDQDDLPTTISNPGIAWDDDPESAVDDGYDDAPLDYNRPEEPTAPGKLPALPPGWSPALVVAATAATFAGLALAAALVFLGASILYSVIAAGA